VYVCAERANAINQSLSFSVEIFAERACTDMKEISRQDRQLKKDVLHAFESAKVSVKHLPT